MSKKGKRKSVSMRDYEYFALKFYMEHLNEGGGEHTITSVLRGIAFGDLPPIPKKYLDMGMEEVLRLEREVPPKKEPENTESLVGGGIWTF